MRRASVHAAPASEVLYNGITLGRPWPPRWSSPNEHPIRPPYLAEPPARIPIDVGRQLFVDDFLIAETNLTRECHLAVYHPANPILRPQTEWELRDDYADRTRTRRNPAAMTYSDGVFYDPRDRLFKMWYMAGYGMFTCLATSPDGVTWQRPSLNLVAGTNIVDDRNRDSSTVWLDLNEQDPQRRYKMSIWYDKRLMLLVSSDGARWTEIGTTGPAGDRSTFFFNPFRGVWCFSVRRDLYGAPNSGRYRAYWESRDFAAARNWNERDLVAWVKADSRDFATPGINVSPELYNLDCVGYESLMVGLFTIWRGETDREKINEVAVGFSRDGFHWSRPDRRAFIAVSERSSDWNWANVQSAGGGCLVVGDRLYFYVSGRQGRPGTTEPGVCSTGLATLRRDGFVSMNWLPDESPIVRRRADDQGTGTLTTRLLQFSGAHLFVNADTMGGELRVEVLDEAGRVVEPFTRSACASIDGDGTKMAVRWASGDLRALAGRPVRFRFTMTRGRLYAFWVSAWPSGESRGYPAAGGPEFAGPIDTPSS
jgi:hypothetical protein